MRDYLYRANKAHGGTCIRFWRTWTESCRVCGQGQDREKETRSFSGEAVRAHERRMRDALKECLARLRKGESCGTIVRNYV